jgi:hypothetical protein
VSTHKEEMDVLFGAYSRSAVEEKRLLRFVDTQDTASSGE